MKLIPTDTCLLKQSFKLHGLFQSKSSFPYVSKYSSNIFFITHRTSKDNFIYLKYILNEKKLRISQITQDISYDEIVSLNAEKLIIMIENNLYSNDFLPICEYCAHKSNYKLTSNCDAEYSQLLNDEDRREGFVDSIDEYNPFS